MPVDRRRALDAAMLRDPADAFGLDMGGFGDAENVADRDLRWCPREFESAGAPAARGEEASAHEDGHDLRHIIFGDAVLGGDVGRAHMLVAGKRAMDQNPKRVACLLGQSHCRFIPRNYTRSKTPDRQSREVVESSNHSAIFYVIRWGALSSRKSVARSQARPALTLAAVLEQNRNMAGWGALREQNERVANFNCSTLKRASLAAAARLLSLLIRSSSGNGRGICQGRRALRAVGAGAAHGGGGQGRRDPDPHRRHRRCGSSAPRLRPRRSAYRGDHPWPLVAEAKEALVGLAQGAEVELRFGGTTSDRHGRALAQVFAVKGDDRVWLQGELSPRGLARVYSFPDNHACVGALSAREAEARAKRLGVWGNSAYRILDADERRASVASHPQLSARGGRGRGGRRREEPPLSQLRQGLAQRFHRRRWRARTSDAFKAEGLDVNALAGKRLRVRGWIEWRNGPMIEVTHLEQIEVLPEAPRLRRPKSRSAPPNGVAL